MVPEKKRGGLQYDCGVGEKGRRKPVGCVCGDFTLTDWQLVADISDGWELCWKSGSFSRAWQRMAWSGGAW